MNSDIIIRLIIIFCVLIITLSFHEFGHFVMAKIFRVNIIQYSIGVGPTLFYFHIRGIKFSFRLFLIGAFVLLDSIELRNYGKSSLLDYDLNTFNKNKLMWSRWKHFFWIHKKGNYTYENMLEFKKISGYLKAKALISPLKKNLFLFNEISYWKKIVILLAGILTNLILFVFFYGISQINETSGNQFKIESIGIFFLDILESFVFINNENSNLFFGDTHLQAFIILGIIFNLFVAIFNAVPFPPLDMFKVVTTTYEKFSNKIISEKITYVFSIIGLIFILYTTIIPIITLAI